jgi:hypothetical protein
MRLERFRQLCRSEWEQGAGVTALCLSPAGSAELACDVMALGGADVAPLILLGGELPVGAYVTELMNPATRMPVAVRVNPDVTFDTAKTERWITAG